MSLLKEGGDTGKLCGTEAAVREEVGGPVARGSPQGVAAIAFDFAGKPPPLGGLNTSGRSVHCDMREQAGGPGGGGLGSVLCESWSCWHQALNNCLSICKKEQ